MKIHFIGDSHVSIFGGDEEVQPIWPEKSVDRINNFKTYRIGAPTAYNLYDNHKNTILQILNNHVNIHEDIIIFCAGEIDCRAHLIKQSMVQSKLIEDIVTECVDKYFNTLTSFKYLGYRVGAWGPTASWTEKKPNTSFPVVGTSKERNYVTKLFNEYLEKLCVKNNIIFETFFFDMVDSDLNTNETYLDNWKGSHIHLSNKSLPLILEKFEKYLNSK